MPQCAVVSVAACHPALADRSRIADEADVVDFGDCDVETTFERRAARGVVPEHGVSTRLNCGIGWRTEVAAAFARRRSDGARDETIDAEAKTALRERGIDRVGWTLAYGIGGERVGGGPWRRSEHFIAVETTLAPARDWLIEAKLGTARDHIARSDRTLWTLAVEHAITEAVETLAEVAGDDRRRPQVSVGLRLHRLV